MTDRNRRRFRKTKIVLLAAGLLVVLAVAGFRLRTRVVPPDPEQPAAGFPKADSTGPGFYTAGNNWLKQSKSGLWEMYLEGRPFERGVIGGRLSHRLIAEQESAFIGQIREMIPSSFYLSFLKQFIYWFNRDLDQYITEEYRQEIFGISLAASDSFSYIGSPYQRMLNYHSAHDIGHALQDYMLVGCTSFGAWGERSADGSLIIGRNFDFYVGDAFARNKIVTFIRPDQGIPFMMVTWGGMAGAVSGMNAEGLTVTINAAKSAIPGSARTPISLVAREILQYASTLKEAYDLASRRETFVSESILVGSATDNQAIILEKSPFRTGLVRSSAGYILCTNHFQSAAFRHDPLNQRDIRENASVYRMRRLRQAITDQPRLDAAGAAKILRDRKGMNGEDIGMGNEKAINQLIAHHSVIFQPGKRLAWVSTSPWQEGAYVCYDLEKIFHTFAVLRHPAEITETEQAIPPDSFLGTDDYTRFQEFRQGRKALKNGLRRGDFSVWRDSLADNFGKSNPRHYEVHELLGDYYSTKGEWLRAAGAYRQALTCTVPRWQEKKNIIKKWVDCRTRLRD